MKILLPGWLLLFTIPCLSQTKESFSVYFDFDSYALNQKAAWQLDSFWRNNKALHLSLEYEIKGYCDNRGTESYNDVLSEKRVATVKNYLLKHGVNIEFIMSALGFGKSSPVNENKTETERQLNRRVDIIIINNTDAPSTVEEEKTSLIQRIADSAITAGTNIILRNINFVGGLHDFLPESQPMLKELLEAMQTYPKLVIRVEGHICCQEFSGDGRDGSTGLNNLSEARAKAVMDYLLENGIEANRVSFTGFGHSAPIYPYPEQTEEERIQNRRVEIKIIRK